MHTSPMQLITIVAEEVLEQHLVRDLEANGATGWTITTAHGRGSRGLRAGASGGGNVRIESVATAEVADAVLERLAEHWFPRYAVVAWVEQVQVVRGEKYR
jgi:nitrogen regulatory protein P-II 2